MLDKYPVLGYACDMDQTNAETWVAACAHCLQKHWRTVDPAQLEEVARELLEHKGLGPMAPAEAAELWLRPVAGTVLGAGDVRTAAESWP